MKTKRFFWAVITLVSFFLLNIGSNVYSQGLFDRVKRKAEKALDKTENSINRKIDKTVDKTVDKALDPIEGKTSASGEKEKKASEQTIIKEENFFQNTSFPESDPNSSRIPIAKNLLIDVEGKYPAGYKPQWRFITYKSELDFEMENYITKRSALSTSRRSIGFADYNGKAVLRFGAFIGCDCYAEIVIDGSQNVITETPQTFKLTNFQKIVNEKSTGEKCKSINNMYTDGGWEGQVTLSGNENGDIKMDLIIENYRLPSRFSEAGVSYRYIAKNITIENEMSAQKANEIVIAEQEAKQRQKDYIVKTTRQADSLQKIMVKTYPQKDCRECFARNNNSSLKITPTKTVYSDGYGDLYVESGTDWDINTKIEIKNKCGYDLTFIGLQQAYDDEKGYYLELVTKTMEKGYSFSSEQGAMASILTSLVGGGSEFNIAIQDKYYPNHARVGAVQWLKVIKK